MLWIRVGRVKSSSRHNVDACTQLRAPIRPKRLRVLIFARYPRLLFKSTSGSERIWKKRCVPVSASDVGHRIFHNVRRHHRPLKYLQARALLVPVSTWISLSPRKRRISNTDGEYLISKAFLSLRDTDFSLCSEKGRSLHWIYFPANVTFVLESAIKKKKKKEKGKNSVSFNEAVLFLFSFSRSNSVFQFYIKWRGI